MRDGVRLVKLLGEAESRNIFMLNRVGEHGRDALNIKEIHKILQVQPTSVVPFLPGLVTPSAHHGHIAANKRGKFANSVAALALEISGRNRRRDWWSWRAA
jgi:Flp pilus assembly CpaE family ATPase